MRFFRQFQVRKFYDVDSGNGGGAADPAGAEGQTPAGGNPPADPVKGQPADPAAAMRYQISRERELRLAAEKKYEQDIAAAKSPKPTFDAETDPDGMKQQEWIAEQKANELFDKKMKELGLEDKLAEIKYEKEQKEFFEVVQNEAEKFKALGIDAPTKEQLKTILTTIDEKGITPEQIILLSQAENIIQRLKPGGFTPWSGTKPAVVVPKSEAEIREEIYKASGAFGRG